MVVLPFGVVALMSRVTHRSGITTGLSLSLFTAHFTNDNVAARIEELRARNAEKCQLSKDQAIQYLVDILKTPIGVVTVDHQLGQTFDAKSGKVELPNKLGAMQLLAKMCGWLTPEKHEIEHGYREKEELIEVIKRMRGGAAAGNDQWAE